MKRKIRKILAFLVILVVIATSISPVKPVQAASKPQFTIKTSNANPKQGETFTAELWLEPNSGLTSFALLYTFDLNTFELVKYAKGETLKEMDLGLIMYDEEDPGEIGVIADWDTEADMAGG